MQALSVAFMVTYSITINNLVDYDYIGVEGGSRLASDLAFIVALAIPPIMAIVFFVYWTQAFLRTPRLERGAGFLGALRVSFLGIAAMLLQAGLLMQSYHADLQEWTGAYCCSIRMVLCQSIFCHCNLRVGHLDPMKYRHLCRRRRSDELVASVNDAHLHTVV